MQAPGTRRPHQAGPVFDNNMPGCNRDTLLGSIRVSFPLAHSKLEVTESGLG